MAFIPARVSSSLDVFSASRKMLIACLVWRFTSRYCFCFNITKTSLNILLQNSIKFTVIQVWNTLSLNSRFKQLVAVFVTVSFAVLHDCVAKMTSSNSACTEPKLVAVCCLNFVRLNESFAVFSSFFKQTTKVIYSPLQLEKAHHFL